MCPAELPGLLPVVQVAEALLRLHNGPQLLTRLLANLPDQFDQGEGLLHWDSNLHAHMYSMKCVYVLLTVA